MLRATTGEHRRPRPVVDGDGGAPRRPHPSTATPRSAHARPRCRRAEWRSDGGRRRGKGRRPRPVPVAPHARRGAELGSCGVPDGIESRERGQHERLSFPPNVYYPDAAAVGPPIPRGADRFSPRTRYEPKTLNTMIDNREPQQEGFVGRAPTPFRCLPEGQPRGTPGARPLGSFGAERIGLV